MTKEQLNLEENENIILRYQGPNVPYVKQYDNDGKLIEPERTTIKLKDGKNKTFVWLTTGPNRQQRRRK